MTQDEIIEMARQAGMGYDEEQNVYIANIDDLQDFAKLATAKEREACALLAATPVGTIAKAIRARGEA